VTTDTFDVVLSTLDRVSVDHDSLWNSGATLTAWHSPAKHTHCISKYRILCYWSVWIFVCARSK